MTGSLQRCLFELHAVGSRAFATASSLNPFGGDATGLQEWAETNGVTLRPVKAPTMSTTYMEVETSEAFVTDDVPETIPAQQILQGHDEIVWAMEVSGRHLFSASADKTIRVWDTMALRCVTVRASLVAAADSSPAVCVCVCVCVELAVTPWICTGWWRRRCWKTTRGQCCR